MIINLGNPFELGCSPECFSYGTVNLRVVFKGCTAVIINERKFKIYARNQYLDKLGIGCSRNGSSLRSKILPTSLLILA
jgi:hypothetical protein